MSQIKISGLQIECCHGVLPFEKTTPQPFVFDVVMDVNFRPAAEGDDLTKTVNYADVCEVINSVCRANVYNLIEKLAYECAFAIMEKFPLVDGVTINLSKPHAPIELKFDNVSVQVSLKRERVLLSLGSSVGNGDKTLSSAIASLGEVRGVKVVKTSSFLKTAPYGGVAQNTFTNCALEVECLISPYELLEEIHKIEARFGRVRTLRWGDRTLDIDIVFFGSRIIAQDGLIVPHPDYANRPFVIEPLKEIAPDFVCPVAKKRVGDM
jgi:dihydroneopterin aldolase/2-amino-4-hydroxy-6-hydroxymethyldihydropteridine diphosphokinase